MCITINNIMGERTIHLSYPICSLNQRKKIAVRSMLSENVQSEMTEPFKSKFIGGDKKQVLNKTYTSRELSVLVERKIMLKDLNNHP